MKIIKADRKHYIRLGDLDHLLRMMRFEIYDKYIRDEEGALYQEDGTHGLTHDDAVITGTIGHVMTKVLENWIHACETPEEIREMRGEIRSEFYMDKYVVTTESEDEDGEKYLAFFRKYCREAEAARYRAEGKSDEEIGKLMEGDLEGAPVFSNYLRDAEFFEDHEDAKGTADHIQYRYGLDVKVVPAWHFDSRVIERLKEVMNDNPEEGEEDE